MGNELEKKYCFFFACKLSRLKINDLQANNWKTKKKKQRKFSSFYSFTNNDVVTTTQWCSGYHYCKTLFNEVWTQILRSFKSAGCMSDISNCENLWQWPRLKKGVNTFRQSTISQKQFIFIILLTLGLRENA